MSLGMSYGEAWHLSPLLATRYTHISQAWSIPPDERVGGTVYGTVADARRLFGG